MRTRILGISGSPRTTGNTSTLVETALKSAKNEEALVEFVDLAELNINECEHCSECYKIGKCIKKMI